MGKNIEDDILNATKEANVTVTMWPLKESKPFKEKVYKKFVNNYTLNSLKEKLWDVAIESITVKHEKAWTWIGDLLEKGDFLLFCDEDKKFNIFTFDSGKDIVKTLEETYWVENFYITDTKLSFLIEYNEYDFISVIGENIEVLLKKKLANIKSI